MWLRDRVVEGREHGAEHLAAAVLVVQVGAAEAVAPAVVPAHTGAARAGVAGAGGRPLYTSDAADARSSVDLGGRRIIKKKTLQSVTIDGKYKS